MFLLSAWFTSVWYLQMHYDIASATLPGPLHSHFDNFSRYKLPICLSPYREITAGKDDATLTPYFVWWYLAWYVALLIYWSIPLTRGLPPWCLPMQQIGPWWYKIKFQSWLINFAKLLRYYYILKFLNDALIFLIILIRVTRHREYYYFPIWAIWYADTY